MSLYLQYYLQTFTFIHHGKSAYVFRSAEDTLTFYYDADRATRNGDTWDIPTTIEDNKGVPWSHKGIRKVIINPSFADYLPTTTAYWFWRFKSLITIEGLEHLNTSEVTDMGCMFCECPALPTLDVSHFDTAKVTRHCKPCSGIAKP